MDVVDERGLSLLSSISSAEHVIPLGFRTRKAVDYKTGCSTFSNHDFATLLVSRVYP